MYNANKLVANQLIEDYDTIFIETSMDTTNIGRKIFNQFKKLNENLCNWEFDANYTQKKQLKLVGWKLGFSLQKDVVKSIIE